MAETFVNPADEKNVVELSSRPEGPVSKAESTQANVAIHEQPDRKSPSTRRYVNETMKFAESTSDFMPPPSRLASRLYQCWTFLGALLLIPIIICAIAYDAWTHGVCQFAGYFCGENVV